MKKDVTAFSRYVLLLLIVFVVWLVLIHKLRKDPNFATFFGDSKSTLYISDFIKTNAEL